MQSGGQGPLGSPQGWEAACRTASGGRPPMPICLHQRHLCVCPHSHMMVSCWSSVPPMLMSMVGELVLLGKAAASRARPVAAPLPPPPPGPLGGCRSTCMPACRGARRAGVPH